jgi:NADPH:quinone reductase-like Zn-dependent oxidoreductase
MRAIAMSEHGGPDVLTVRELPDPVPEDGDVLIAVKAFGLNHADTYMRSGVWSFGIDVLGIECAGVVLEDDEIAEAHRLMDAGRAGGKLVVTVAP